MTAKGYLALVLHAHLPYVRHPEHEEFLEEDWLFEAIIETYLPLLSVVEGLKKDMVEFSLTISFSPTLTSMLQDSLLKERFLRHLNRLIELSEKEVERTAHIPELNDLASNYLWSLSEAKKTYIEKYDCDIISAFGNLMDAGYLEIITCAATHGFLPLISQNELAVKAQIRIACDHHEKVFGKRPKGFWLPECAYYPGVEKHLKNEGILFFFVDSHGVLHSKPRPKYGVFAPVFTENGIAVFGRDTESSLQVWSARHGYPGDPVYRDFYRDIGFDLDLEYIKPYIQPTGHRKMTGIKYHRITGQNVDKKEIYDRQKALLKASEHAADFIEKRIIQLQNLSGLMDRPPIITAPYDAELFGHWWSEGPDFLNFLFRKIHHGQSGLKTITPVEYLRLYPLNQPVSLSASSWGSMGFSNVWLNESNDWIYPHLHKSAERMEEMATRFYDANGTTLRAMNQAMRELLLAQGSDWAFIMKTGGMVPYAEKRVKDHVSRFNRLYKEVMAQNIDEGFLKEIESMDNIFPDIDIRIFASRLKSR